MTDMHRWDELVQLVRLRCRDIITGEFQYWDGQEQKEPIFAEYVTVPLNDYHLANLLDALMDAEDTGDWLWEVISMLRAAMLKAGINEVTSNRNNTFKIDEPFEKYRRK